MLNNKKVEYLLEKITHSLIGVSGIDAIVLGGSRATETSGKDSDIDIGIYYDSSTFDFITFRQKAILFDDEHRQDAITRPGDWGAWINGGGWLKIDDMAVDILFRETKNVIAVIEDCVEGNITIDYQCGHPFGFVNSIYMGEVVYCKILNSNNQLIQKQKNSLKSFPPIYQKAAIVKFMWECEFSLLCGKKSIQKGDVLYAAGSLFRCWISLLQVLYAINELYMLNEKGCLQRLQQQKDAYIPKGFAQDAEAALSNLTQESIASSFDKVQEQYDLLNHYIQSNTLSQHTQSLV